MLTTCIVLGLVVLLFFPGVRKKLLGTAGPNDLTIPGHPEWSVIVDEIIAKLLTGAPLLAHELAAAVHFRAAIVTKKLGIDTVLDRAVAAAAPAPSPASAAVPPATTTPKPA